MFRILTKAKSRARYLYAGMAIAVTAGLFFASAGFLPLEDAQALRVSMKRVIFEGPKRSDIITIINNSADEETYRLGWRHYRMTENEALTTVPEDQVDTVSDIRWADDMIRFAPRRVTVPPGASQQIRLLLRRPSDLQAGEYRSHLWIVTETKPIAFSADGLSKGQQGVKIAMQPALSMPVFVRHGELAVTASITDAKLVSLGDNKIKASFVVGRNGNRSLYGDISIVCTGGGDDFIAKQSRGIAVYTEITRRTMQYEFEYPAEKASACRTVRIEYVADTNDPQYGGKVMAQAQASIGG